jgi:hypothetical protein
MDPRPGGAVWIPTLQLAADMENVIGRMVRLVGSGLDRLVVKEHRFGKVKVISMLTSNGKYAAMVHPKGKVYEGATRNDAMQSLKLIEGL